jgi:hypothetical protein
VGWGGVGWGWGVGGLGVGGGKVGELSPCSHPCKNIHYRLSKKGPFWGPRWEILNGNWMRSMPVQKSPSLNSHPPQISPSIPYFPVHPLPSCPSRIFQPFTWNFALLCHDHPISGGGHYCYRRRLPDRVMQLPIPSTSAIGSPPNDPLLFIGRLISLMWLE